MTTEIKEFLDDLDLNSSDLGRLLDKALDIQFKTIQDIEALTEGILQSWFIAFRNLESRLINQGRNILLEEAIIATELTEEFDVDVFKSRLINAINDVRTLSIAVPKRKNVSVFIDLETSGGTIEDYAQMVRAARDVLGLGKLDPERASVYWKKIYKAARRGAGDVVLGEKESQDAAEKYAQQYWDTIYTRIGLLESEAPFWYIINHGNISPPFKGRGGTAFPRYGPTNFVEKARQKIKNNSLNLLNTENSRVKQDLSDGKNTLEDLLNGLDKAIEEIQKRLEDPQYRFKVALEYLEERVDDLGRLENASRESLREVARSLAEGTAPARVEIRRIGPGPRIRPRLIDAQREINIRLGR